jgi:Fe-S oxidoreductase
MIGLFWGCTTLMLDELREGVEKLLGAAGVEYVPLGIDQCCGIPLVLAGRKDEAARWARGVADDILGRNLDLLVTSCPHCYTAFNQEYPEHLGVEFPLPVEHLMSFAHRLLREGKLTFTKPINLKLAYHDPCYIGRKGTGLYEEPREFLRAIPGLEIVDPVLNRREATCCGGGGLVRPVYPKICVEIAREKLEQQLMPLGVDGVVSSCPFCYLNLKDGAESVPGQPLTVHDATLLAVESMGL